MKVDLIPYKFSDQAIKDSAIKALFTRTVEDGLDGIVFYDGTVQTPDEFLEMAKMDGVLFFLMFVDQSLVGYTWLNNFESHTARQHFCVFKEFWGQSIDLGKAVLAEFMNMKDMGGNFIWDLLTGFVPAWNDRAIKFSLKCGGKVCGEIPNLIWNDKTQQSEPGVFIYYMRGEDGRR